MINKEIIEAWAWVRQNNQSIPDNVLDFMKDSAIAALQNKVSDVNYSSICKEHKWIRTEFTTTNDDNILYSIVCRKCGISKVSDINLESIQKEIDTLLEGETNESLSAWYNNQKVSDVSEDVKKGTESSNGYSVFAKGGDKYNYFNKGFKCGPEWQSQQPIPTVDEETEFKLLLMIKNELLSADKLPFSERHEATIKILESFSITRK